MYKARVNFEGENWVKMFLTLQNTEHQRSCSKTYKLSIIKASGKYFQQSRMYEVTKAAYFQGLQEDKFYLNLKAVSMQVTSESLIVLLSVIA